MWWGVDRLLGRSLPAQLLSVGGAALVAFLTYAGAVLLLRVPEAQQIQQFVAGRLARGRSSA